MYYICNYINTHTHTHTHTHIYIYKYAYMIYQKLNKIHCEILQKYVQIPFIKNIIKNANLITLETKLEIAT